MLQRLLALAALSAGCCGCAETIRIGRTVPLDVDPCPAPLVSYAELPTVNLPVDARYRNWGGSCFHASLIQCMRWQGLGEIADWWRQTYGGSESVHGLSQKCERKGLRFATCATGDAAFLEWACRTRRGAALGLGSNHAQTLVHLDAKWAGILNSNTPKKIDWYPREKFLNRWHSGAITVVYSPAAPLAHAAPKPIAK